MRTGLRDNNKGFSLVELVTVIGIMSVMLGMFLLSTNVIGRRACRQCTKQLKHELDQVRVSSMGKNKVVLHLYKGADNKIMVQQETTIAEVGTSANTVVVPGLAREAGSARVRVEFVSSLAAPGDAPTEINSSGIYFEFNRSTGAFKKASGGQVAGDYTIKEIYVTGGGLTQKLSLSEITGKVTED